MVENKERLAGLNKINRDGLIHISLNHTAYTSKSAEPLQPGEYWVTPEQAAYLKSHDSNVDTMQENYPTPGKEAQPEIPLYDNRHYIYTPEKRRAIVYELREKRKRGIRFTKASYASEKGINPRTLYNWEKEFPENDS